jgi:hypothetical protein
MLGSRSLTTEHCKPLPTRLLLYLALSVALLAGCGGGAAGSERASSSTDVNQLLRDTFQNLDKITSADLSAKLAIDGQGQKVGATLRGPFQSQGAGKLPRFQLDATLDSGGRSFTAGATWTGDKGFVSVQGTQYALSGLIASQLAAGYEEAAKSGQNRDKGLLAALGIDFSKWLKSGSNAGEAQVGDIATVKVTGEADVARVIDDLQRVADRARTLNLPGTSSVPQKITPQQRQEIVDAIKKLAVEVYTGRDDRILRRLVVDADLQDPASKAVSHIVFDLTLAKVGDDQQISEPKDAKPFGELVKVVDQLKGLGGLAGGSGSGSGSAAPSAASLDKYAKCIEQSQGDSAKAQKCAALLGG